MSRIIQPGRGGPVTSIPPKPAALTREMLRAMHHGDVDRNDPRQWPTCAVCSARANKGLARRNRERVAAGQRPVRPINVPCDWAGTTELATMVLFRAMCMHGRPRVGPEDRHKHDQQATVPWWAIEAADERQDDVRWGLAFDPRGEPLVTTASGKWGRRGRIVNPGETPEDARGKPGTSEKEPGDNL